MVEEGPFYMRPGEIGRDPFESRKSYLYHSPHSRLMVLVGTGSSFSDAFTNQKKAPIAQALTIHQNTNSKSMFLTSFVS